MISINHLSSMLAFMAAVKMSMKHTVVFPSRYFTEVTLSFGWAVEIICFPVHLQSGCCLAQTLDIEPMVLLRQFVTMVLIISRSQADRNHNTGWKCLRGGIDRCLALQLRITWAYARKYDYMSVCPVNMKQLRGHWAPSWMTVGLSLE